MSALNLRLHIGHTIEPIPDWISFAIGLGAFLHEEGYKYGENAHIVVLLPVDLYFSLFVAVGIADRQYNTRKQMSSIINQIMSLKPNSRIIFHDGGVAKEVSVLSIEPSPANSNEMLLYIQDGSMKRGIPERKWFESITILDEEFRYVKRTRKIKDSKKVGIQSKILKKLYTESQLNKVSFYPGDYFYLIGDRVEINSIINDPFFYAEGVVGSISDFLYVENLTQKGSYTNGKFLSAHLKKPPLNVDHKVPVLYSNALSYRKQRKHFLSNPSLIVLGRSDQPQRIFEIASNLASKIIQNNNRIINNEVLEFLEEYGSKIPTGIEMLAWREK